MVSQPKKRILIKISGGCLQASNSSEFFDHDKLIDLCLQIKEISKTYQVGLVVGGGNLWRGKSNYLQELHDQTSHYIGMLATVMNGLVFHDFLAAVGVKSKVYSSLQCGQVANQINILNLREELGTDQVLIFTGGAGIPYVSTDTGSAIRAIEIGADIILMGKDNVDGVYSDDPKKNPDAVFYDKMSYDQIIQNKLSVMDNASVNICKENNIKILVFNQSSKNAFVRALNDDIVMTKISS
ncbi:uridylate kinase [Mycoplasmoides fastidiosum]|uniref:Uridylate kinase n=1 Tax=Mycoplasmoides fastidiosum TaxID=92758 RepID=A0ABU0LZR1_9BACT|nr:UMP kinase [Mycoplasmoides fastidiosum]MDQ0514194.1 uridylate kinase [Mycoplasmoides fastidiosum]UUD37396.1 UMP kinase [Mycoplasmoides fastidiosum]